MPFDKTTFRQMALLVFGGVTLFALYQHHTVILELLGFLWSLCLPFLLGAALAFVLNVPMRAIEKKLRGRGKKPTALSRAVALVLSLVLIAAVIAVLMLLIIPELGNSLDVLIKSMPGFYRRVAEWATALGQRFPEVGEMLAEIDFNWQTLLMTGLNMLRAAGEALFSSTVGTVGSVVGALVTAIIAFVFCIYILLQKEKLARQGKMLLYAALPQARAERVLDVLRLSDKTFSRFLSGQCIEALILGGMFVVAMSILRFPYAVMVGALIAFTALIPIVGAFIGCFVGAFLILIVDPMQALWFVVMFLVLQQIEGNLIYPHVVGNSVGLPSMWVLAAVSIGGKLMGVVGMVVFIPLCSVCYVLLRDWCRIRLRQKEIPEEKYS